ncbi:hypothetical protein M1N13_01620, partial [Dehalococcoidia bacterium]|nr:hypothetical protein [Dehalococcoidia bacterium]
LRLLHSVDKIFPEVVFQFTPQNIKGFVHSIGIRLADDRLTPSPNNTIRWTPTLQDYVVTARVQGSRLKGQPSPFANYYNRANQDRLE